MAVVTNADVVRYVAGRALLMFAGLSFAAGLIAMAGRKGPSESILLAISTVFGFLLLLVSFLIAGST